MNEILDNIETVTSQYGWDGPTSRAIPRSSWCAARWVLEAFPDIAISIAPDGVAGALFLEHRSKHRFLLEIAANGEIYWSVFYGSDGVHGYTDDIEVAIREFRTRGCGDE